ncbi:MAG: AsmA-like C-terminal region-containing protein [Crocinitomicaceae bacterium]
MAKINLKKILKKSIKWTGISLLVIIILLIIIPIIFKDEIKEMVIKEVNKSLKAELSVGDFDLTFISTFPNMTIELMDSKLQGLDDFKDVTLAEIKLLQAHVGFWDVVTGDQIKINEIHIVDPTFDVRVLQNGLANYDIVKAEEDMTPEEVAEPSNFSLSLTEYSITNGNINYSDEASDMHASIVNLNHTGYGDLTADVIDFNTETTMDQLSFDMEGASYLRETKTEAVINLLMEFTDKTSKFTLKENEIKLNALTFSIDGFYEMFEKKDKIDLKLNASKASFKDFLSLIPTFYHSGYESMVTSGNLALDAEVKGDLDEKNLPGWDVNLVIGNASIKYPGLPGKISNIQVKGGSKFVGGDNLDKMTVDVTKFHANLSKNTIDANLMLRNIMTDPFIQSKITANVNLATLKDFVPMEEGESYSGILDADVNIKGRMSSLEKEDFEAFTAEGTLLLSKMNYKSKSLPDDVNIERMKFTFSPENLALNELNATMGKSDFAIDGKVDNYFGYFLRDEILKGDFNFNSNYLDLDQLMPASESTESTSKSSKEAVSTAVVEPLLIPGNVDFRLNTNIKSLKYNGIDVKNVNGGVALKEEVATLDNLTMNAMGGTVGLKGNYNTTNHAKPKMDIAFSLKEIDINQLATNFLTIEKLAPITKHAFGDISADFNMNTELTASFEPILSSIDCLGALSSNSISVKGFKNLEKIEAVTKLKNLSNQTINNFKTKFKIKDGKVTLTPFDINLGKIGTEVSGFTTLDSQMDYDLKMNVPKDQIPTGIIAEVEKALKQINALVPQLKLAELPAFIPVKVKMIGDVKNPKITTDFKEAIMKLTGNLKDNIKETIKDTITSVINNGIDKAKEEIEKQKQKIMTDAQKQADKVIAEGDKAAERARAEGYKQADELVKAAGSNPIKKKIAEEAAKKARSETDKQVEKTKAAARKQADVIMAKAREEADKVK